MAQQKIDPEEVMFTLDQLEQTTEVMHRVVSRFKRQLALQQEQFEHRSNPDPNASPRSSSLH